MSTGTLEDKYEFGPLSIHRYCLYSAVRFSSDCRPFEVQTVFFSGFNQPSNFVSFQ